MTDTYDNKQFIKAIHQFWKEEIKMCTINRSVLKAVHKSVQKLYDVQQALEKGETALARRLAENLDSHVRDAIPNEVWNFMKFEKVTL